MNSNSYDSPVPGSIGAQIYRGQSFDKIKTVNPFATVDWLNNTADFSDVRSAAVDALFEKGDEISLSEINKRTGNAGRYAAFRAIAHEVATWVEESQHLVKAK